MRSRSQIDHFIPWARHVHNAIENLVFAHDTCNNAKSAFLAAEDHVERWLARMRDRDSLTSLASVAQHTHWEHRPPATQAIGAATYLMLPESYKLSAFANEFTPINLRRLQVAFAAAA